MPVTFDEFDKSNRETWLTKVAADLKGARTIDDLDYSLEPGLSVSPFITNENIIHKDPLHLPQTLQGIIVDHVDNKTIIQTLEQGANALMIKLSTSANLSEIFREVITDIIYFVVDDSVGSEDEQKKIRAFFEGNKDIIFVSDGVAILAKDTTFVERIAKVKENPTQPIFLYLKDDFLGQIAELRAMRKLGVSKIMAFSSFEGDHLQDQGALIAHTYQLMAAHLGGADIAFGPSSGSNLDFGRLGLNVQHVLNMESHIGLVADTMAGSYIVEEMVEKMLGSDYEK